MSWSRSGLVARRPKPRPETSTVSRRRPAADMRARFTALNMADPPIKTVEQFAQTVRDDIAAWGGVIRTANVKPEG